MTNKNRTKYLAIAIIAVIAVSAVAVYAYTQASQASPPGELVTIRLSEFNTGNLAVDWAVEKGLFEKQGLKVETWTTDSGSAATQAILAGSSDMHSGDFSLLSSSVANGADIKGFLYASANDFLVATTKDSPIQSVEDLKGKTVGISRYGSGTDLSLRALVTQYGLDPDKDLNIVQIGNTGIIAAILGKTIDAGVTQPTSVQQEAGLKVVAVVREEIPGFGGGTFFTSSAFIEEHPDALKAFAKVILESEKQIAADPNAAAEFYAAKFAISKDDAKIFVDTTIATWDLTSTFGHFEGREEGLNSTIDWMVQLDVIPQAIPLDHIIVYGFAP
jgi:NitT/TauT family transport system substrate-binding protein